MKNEGAIKFLGELNDEACVLILTRHDAEAMADRTILDNEWSEICSEFNDTLPDDYIWEIFSEIIHGNLEDNNASG